MCHGNTMPLSVAPWYCRKFDLDLGEWQGGLVVTLQWTCILSKPCIVKILWSRSKFRTDRERQTKNNMPSQCMISGEEKYLKYMGPLMTIKNVHGNVRHISSSTRPCKNTYKQIYIPYFDAWLMKRNSITKSQIFCTCWSVKLPCDALLTALTLCVKYMHYECWLVEFFFIKKLIYFLKWNN